LFAVIAAVFGEKATGVLLTSGESTFLVEDDAVRFAVGEVGRGAFTLGEGPASAASSSPLMMGPFTDFVDPVNNNDNY
jgi:hypothetical protein